MTEGHILGNHNYYHRDMTKLSTDVVLEELEDTQPVIERIPGSHFQIRLFRPSCGAPYNTETDKLPIFQRVAQEQKCAP